MAIVYDRNKRAHAAVNFVICVDTGNTQLLTMGRVYANLGKCPATADNIFIIDDRGLKQNFSCDRFQPYTSEKQLWYRATKEHVNIQRGKLYQVTKTSVGSGSPALPGFVYALDDSGCWMSYSSSSFAADQFKVTYSAQYQCARMMATIKPESSTGTVSHRYSSTAGATSNLPKMVISFTPADVEAEESKVKYVQVTFKPGERTYTYKWKGDVKVGDEAVVRVENDNYPELCGTKIVDVVAVLDHNPTRFNLKYLVDVVNMDRYRARQEAESKIAEAEAALQNRIDAIQREEMMRILSERDPVAALLMKEINELKKII